MVGGHRSLGCGRCRQRKCNLERPVCDHCRRRDEKCGDWPEALAFNLLDCQAPLTKTRHASPPMPTRHISGNRLSQLVSQCRKTLAPLVRASTSTSMSLSGGGGGGRGSGPFGVLALQRPACGPVPSLGPALTPGFKERLKVDFERLYLPQNLCKQPDRETFPSDMRSAIPCVKRQYLILAANIVHSGRSRTFEKAYYAMMLVFVGRDRQDTALMAQGADLYQQVLSSLQKLLARVDNQNLPAHWLPAVMTICCCSWVELVGLPLSDSSPSADISNNIKHLTGGGSMLSQLGMARGAGMPYFYESIVSFRVQSFFAFIARRQCPAFLTSEPWLYRSWGAKMDAVTNSLQTLMDDALQVPVMMHGFDKATASKSPRSDAVTVDQVERLLLTADETAEALESWASTNPPEGEWNSSSWSTEAPKDSYYAFFDCHDGSAYMMYCAVRICLVDLRQQMASWLSALPPSPSVQHDSTGIKLDLAQRIFRSVEYFFEPRHGITTKSQVLGPYRIAKRTLAAAVASDAAEYDTPLSRWRFEWLQLVDQKYAAYGYPS